MFGAKKKVMIKTELPKLEGVGALADGVRLATGVLTFEDSGAQGLSIRSFDIIDYSTDEYTAGVAEVATIDLTASTLVANNMYSLSVKLPNTIAFFGGNAHATSDTRESDAIYVTRTYKVSTDATPSATELAALFAAQMTADLFAAFTATAAVGVITITAQDATAGSFILNVSNIAGTVVTVTTANVLPVGEPKEVMTYINADLVTAGSYDRHVIKYRKYIRHNAVKGNKVVKEEKIILFSTVASTLGVVLDPMLDGSHTPVANYLGAPVV
tara:strand:+ start:3972 stop:4784 length:813 start_codon:yes stop_codon:yes gene_type:complete